ncbi:uncharacterized protein B0H18DRAFT_659760 [Fomitopsis serialis]|uniref:uncharacterized protein n=1 Tax=Fomitopsis serialis TaxID=139415 RepID=UPI002008B422|nr:uncharacterized protein B0H18DRAFT_659760 [Neoantrodia serialis]KAH9918974.1 hypothetical protein B0H18DRAFT_659760 [Neoantrodia serialis]
MPKTRNIRKPRAVPPPVKRDANEPQASGSSRASAQGKVGPVKRASSLVPFPTPPRTTHKRKRARSRITDSDSEEDERGLELPSIDEEGEEASGKRDGNGALILGYKKRKTLDAIAEELSEAQVEEAFWMGRPVSAKSGQSSSKVAETSRGRQRSRSPTRSPSSSPPPAPHLLRRQHTGLASPPPSKRQPRTYVIRNVRTRRQTPPPAPAPSVSSETRAKKPGLFPERDTPDNPFLADSSPGPSSAVATGSEPPRTPERRVEKPTVTWVFRGKKVELANPHYKSPGAPESEQDAAALLPETHPDYSPPATYAPKLLFPEARRDLRPRRTPSVEPRTPTRSLPSPRVETRSQSRARSRSRAATVDSDDEESELPQAKAHALAAVPEAEEEEVDEAALGAAMAKRLAQRIGGGGSGSGSRSGSSNATTTLFEPPMTRARARAAPRVPDKDSDPARRAMGPVRTVKG